MTTLIDTMGGYREVKFLNKIQWGLKMIRANVISRIT
jgi:hypothetical protein